MKQVILAMNPKADPIPDAYLEVVTKNFNTFSGLAFKSVKDGKPIFHCGHYGPVTAAEIKDFISAHYEVPTLIVLGKHEGELQKDDMQPFVLFDKEGVPELVCAIEGDGFIEDFSPSGSSHTPAFFVATTKIIPMLQSSLDLNGRNFKKLWEDLQNPMVSGTLKDLPKKGDGAIVMMRDNGHLLAFSKRGGATPFGWASNLMGMDFGTKAVEGVHVTAATPSKFGSMISTAASAVANIVAPGPKATPVVPDDDDVVVVPPKETPATAIPDEVIKIAPPNDYNQQMAKDFYRTYIGKTAQLPVGWKDKPRPTIEVKKSALRPEHIRLLNGLIGPSTLVPAKEKAAPVKDFKDINPKTTKPPVDDKMILTDLETENLLTVIASPVFQKHVIAQGELIKNPAEWAKAEEKYPSATEQMGLSMDDIMTWPYASLDIATKGFPKFMVLLFIEFRRKWAMAQAAIPKTAKVEDIVATALPKVEPAKVATPAPTPAATDDEDDAPIRVVSL